MFRFHVLPSRCLPGFIIGSSLLDGIIRASLGAFTVAHEEESTTNFESGIMGVELEAKTNCSWIDCDDKCPQKPGRIYDELKYGPLITELDSADMGNSNEPEEEEEEYYRKIVVGGQSRSNLTELGNLRKKLSNAVLGRASRQGHTQAGSDPRRVASEGPQRSQPSLRIDSTEYNRGVIAQNVTGQALSEDRRTNEERGKNNSTAASNEDETSFGEMYAKRRKPDPIRPSEEKSDTEEIYTESKSSSKNKIGEGSAVKQSLANDIIDNQSLPKHHGLRNGGENDRIAPNEEFCGAAEESDRDMSEDEKAIQSCNLGKGHIPKNTTDDPDSRQHWISTGDIGLSDQNELGVSSSNEPNNGTEDACQTDVTPVESLVRDTDGVATIDVQGAPKARQNRVTSADPSSISCEHSTRKRPLALRLGSSRSRGISVFLKKPWPAPRSPVSFSLNRSPRGVRTGLGGCEAELEPSKDERSGTRMESEEVGEPRSGTKSAITVWGKEAVRSLSMSLRGPDSWTPGSRTRSPVSTTHGLSPRGLQNPNNAKSLLKRGLGSPRWREAGSGDFANIPSDLHIGAYGVAMASTREQAQLSPKCIPMSPDSTSPEGSSFSK